MTAVITENILDLMESGGEAGLQADLSDIQHRIGGGVVYLDAENRPNLVDFYENKTHYKKFGERFSKSDNTKYLQYMRFF